MTFLATARVRFFFKIVGGIVDQNLLAIERRPDIQNGYFSRENKDLTHE